MGRPFLIIERERRYFIAGERRRRMAWPMSARNHANAASSTFLKFTGLPIFSRPIPKNIAVLRAMRKHVNLVLALAAV